MTCPENVGNRISEDLNFKILLGRMPRTRKSRYYNPRQVLERLPTFAASVWEIYQLTFPHNIENEIFG